MPQNAEFEWQDASGYRGTALAIYKPSNTSEVRELARKCSSELIPLTVVGAGTGLTGASVPKAGVLVSLERFQKLEIGEGVARCGSGVRLADLHQAAAKTHQFLGPNPTEISASVGGAISTNASGSRSFQFGSMRQQVRALESTFMNASTSYKTRGELIDFPVQRVRSPGTRKNSAGYPLRPDLEWIDLLAGSEGTLAIVTEAELKLYPEPATILAGVVFFPSDDLALEAVSSWRSIAGLRALEYMDAHALSFLRDQFSSIPPLAQAAVLVEQGLISEEDEEIEIWDARLSEHSAFVDESWFGFTANDRERFRQFRHKLAVTVTDRARRNGFPKFGTDFAVPVENYLELHRYYRRRCDETFPEKYTIFGHVGDANTHVNLLPETPEEAADGARLIDEFGSVAIQLGGTVAAEHGIGKVKTDLLKLMFSQAEIEAMKAVKRRLDPDWLLGQGTLFEARG